MQAFILDTEYTSVTNTNHYKKLAHLLINNFAYLLTMKKNHTKTNILKLLFVSFLSFITTFSYASEITVSPGESIADAIKQAREWRRLARIGHKEYQEKIAGGITISIQSGTYQLSKPIFIRPEDSGTADSPTRIIGEKGTIISGGVKIEKWSRDEGNLYITQAPKFNGRYVEARQLWRNGKKAMFAQSDKKDELSRILEFDKENKRIIISEDDLKGVVVTENGNFDSYLEMYLCQRWAIAILRIKGIKKLGNGTCEVTFHEPESQIEFAHPWPQPVVEGDNRSAFTLRGATNLLDEPDEWCNSGKDWIYYYSTSGEPNDVVIPALSTLFIIEGSEQTPISHISFKNINFEHSAWNRPSYEGHVTLQAGFRMIDAYKLPTEGLWHKAGLENQAWIERAESAVTVRNASNISFDGCTFQHLGATGLDMIDNVCNSDITNCTFQDIGGTAIQLGNFGERAFETHIPYTTTNPTKLCNNIYIFGNEIHDVTNEDWGCVGISAGYVRDVTIENNHIYDLNYSGICVGWGWTKLDSSMKRNIIRNNKIHDFAKQLYDAGGIYTLSYQPESQIVDNEIHNIGPSRYATNNRAFYIYFDEATDGFLVKGNKMYSDHPIPSERLGYNQPGPNMKIMDK